MAIVVVARSPKSLRAMQAATDFVNPSAKTKTLNPKP